MIIGSDPVVAYVVRLVIELADFRLPALPFKDRCEFSWILNNMNRDHRQFQTFAGSYGDFEVIFSIQD